MHKDGIRIGVITANYNNGKYFQEYLDGLLKQTRKPDIVSIVDDGSKDDSVKTIDSILSGVGIKTSMGETPFGTQHCYQIKGITFIFTASSTNGGPARARNIAFNFAQDTDITFVYDSDDIYYPEKIEKTIEVYKKYPHVGLVYSDYDTWNEKDKTVIKEFKEPFSYRRLAEECIVSNNSAYLSLLFKDLGGYDESLFGPEDYDLWLRIAENVAVYHIPISLYRYRISGNNITITTPKTKFAEHVRRVHQKRIERTNGQR